MCCIGAIIASYFVIANLLYGEFVDGLEYLQVTVPLFYNRYRYIMLVMGIMRERILFNNTLNSMENDPVYGRNLDYKYNELSTENEKALLDVKSSHRDLINDLVDVLVALDSPAFCETVVKDTIAGADTLVSTFEIKNIGVKTTTSYQALIDTIYRGCEAARLGKFLIMRKLYGQFKINYNYGDYDRRTPLYYAARGDRMSSVVYLIDEAKVAINTLDRWGATAMDYTIVGSSMESIFIERKGIRTQKEQIKVPLNASVNLTDNQARLMYAIFYGDMDTLQVLDNIGSKFDFADIDGRMPLHIAASEGKLDIVKFLLNKGADITKTDNRGNTAKDDAAREKHAQI